MYYKSTLLASLILFLSTTVFSQNTAQKANAELDAKAIEFLKSTSNEIGLLRTPENRISFNSELAALMWYHDENQARRMFGSVITDFRQMLVQIDAQLVAYNVESGNDDSYSVPFRRAISQKAKLLQKLRTAMGVRRQIAMAISEHDAILALEFFDETGRLISNQKLRDQNNPADAFFENQLLEKIAEQDPGKILALARKSLEKGITYNTFGLLEKIYKQNAKDGAAFGEEIFSKIKQGKVGDETKIYYFNKILQYAMKESPIVNPPIFSQSVIREAADLMASELLSGGANEEYDVADYLKNIEIFAPGRAAQVRQKFSLKKSSGSQGNEKVATKNAPPPLAESGATELKEENPLEFLEKLEKDKISPGDKEKILAQARQKIAEVEEPMMKIMLISQLAGQLSKMGDKESASELMREAEAFGTQYPRNYLDYIQNYMLASGYAEVEPEKAFPILESSIVNLNETISAFIKVGEFIDVGGEFIEDGEVQVGAFGGAFINGFLSELGQGEGTIRNLVKTDFQRTADLAGKFDRTELRILVKMLILRSLINKKGETIVTIERDSNTETRPDNN